MLWQRIGAATRPTRFRNARTPRFGRDDALVHRPLTLESLESRELLAADLTPVLAPAAFHPTIHELAPLSSSSPAGQGYSPSQIRHAYGLDQVLFGTVQGDGTGQTIAIIDAYHSPTIQHDLHAFDLAFGLPDPPSFRVVAEDGSTNYPRTDPSGRGSLNWETETALDVEWAHAMAPGADLLLVEGTAPTSEDLLERAADFARRQPGVSAVSMSFGSGEFSDETLLDGNFTTVAGHRGVTFVAASGDSGTPPIYPAVSPNVVAIGGTRLSVDSAGNYLSESGWSGSGGGISTYEPTPAYQNGALPGLWRRGAPDVAFDADPASGVPVYDSYNFGTGAPWIQVGGTSFSSPAWAGVIAVANQGRMLAGLDSLDGATQTLPLLYSVSAADFHDVTRGSNGLSAGIGFDLVTGRGTPNGGPLIADMASATTFGTPGDGGPGSGGGSSTPPANDDFAAATALSGSSATSIGGNVGASQQAGEPNVARVSGGHSVWWTWTAPASGTVVVTTRGSDFDTTLGVFRGASVNALTSIAVNDDEALLAGVLTSRVSFSAVAGTTYRLAVDGYHGAAGNILLALNETVAPPRVVPANDNFSQRTILTGANVSATGTNVGGSVQSGEPRIAGIAGGHSVWWSWKAPATGMVTISTAGSDYDTLLGVYTGTAVNRLRLVASNDDQNYGARILTSRVTFRAVAGTTYQIAVDGYHGATGHIALRISQGTATNVAQAAGRDSSTTMAAAAVDRALAELVYWQMTSQGGKNRQR
jgi:hypothetical protein